MGLRTLDGWTMNTGTAIEFNLCLYDEVYHVPPLLQLPRVNVPAFIPKKKQQKAQWKQETYGKRLR